jgi:hypothetical protein
MALSEMSYSAWFTHPDLHPTRDAAEQAIKDFDATIASIGDAWKSAHFTEPVDGQHRAGVLVGIDLHADDVDEALSDAEPEADLTEACDTLVAARVDKALSGSPWSVDGGDGRGITRAR